MKKTLSKLIWSVVTLACTISACSKVEPKLSKKEGLANQQEIAHTSALVDFDDSEWKGVVWEPFNFNWTNQGTINDGTDIVNAGGKWSRIWFTADATTAQMDAMVNLNNSKGIKIVACYMKANPEHDLGDATQQAQQVTQLQFWVNRYKTSIHYWEIGNENNLQSYWNIGNEVGMTTAPNEMPATTPFNVGVHKYVSWLQLAYNTIKGADATATVILGGVSSWTGTLSPWMNRFRLESGYDYIDEAAYHPYEVNPDWVIATLNTFKKQMALWPSTKNNMPIWITEFGFHVGSISSPGPVPDEATKATYLATSYKKLMQNLNWRRPIFWYILHETNPGSNYYNLINRSTDTGPTTFYAAYTSYQGLNSSWLYNQGGGGSPINHEGETSIVNASSTGDAVSNFWETGPSNGAATLLNSNAIGDYITFTIPNIPAGSYTITIGVKKGNNRGKFKLFATPLGNPSGSYIGSEQDLFSASPSYNALTLGTWTPTITGSKSFKFEVSAKNASSSNYTLAIDYIKLTKL